MIAIECGMKVRILNASEIVPIKFHLCFGCSGYSFALSWRRGGVFSERSEAGHIGHSDTDLLSFLGKRRKKRVRGLETKGKVQLIGFLNGINPVLQS